MNQKKNLIIEFKENLKRYESLDQAMYGVQHANPEMYELREWLNRNVPMVATYIREIGENTYLFYSPPPMIGGPVTNIDVFTNLFFLENYSIEMPVVYDMLDRAIGRYEYHIKNRWKKWINPFYWIGQLIRLPFKLVQFAGFDSSKAEFSWLGKVYKLVSYIAILVVGLSTVYANLKPTINRIFNLDLP